MPTILSVLQNKKHNTVHSISPVQTVYEAIALMSDKGIGALVVLEHGKLVGVFSERDYTRKVALMDRSSKQTLVSEIMTTTVTTISPQQTVDQGLGLMTDKHIRHLPVMDGELLVGMLSIGDLVKSVMDEQRDMIDQLHTYIAR